jgi:hypothetical protein
MTAHRRLGLAALSVAALCSCECAPAMRPAGDSMTPKYTVVPAISGASRIYLGTGSTSLVAEHRAWLDEAYRERAAEAPGVLQLVRTNGAAAHVVSGWSLGGPVGEDMAWIEETGEEYRYRVARTGGPGSSGSPLTPPDDFWAVAAAVGHVQSPLGAVVLWRPARGTSVRDPSKRRDELWIAAIDRKTGMVVKSRELALTLPKDRVQGVFLGGPNAEPILLLVGLPDPGGPGSYRAVGLRMPSLDTAWELSIDVSAVEASRGSQTPATPGAASSPPPPAASFTGDDLRTLYGSMGTPLGDGSGWLFAHGHRLRRVLSIELSFLVTADGKATWLRDLHLTGTDELGPIVGEPAALLIGKVGPRDGMRFASVDAVWPAKPRVQTLADERTKVQGRTLGDSPDLLPMSAALSGSVLFVAPPVGGTGLGADSADVRGKQTTPTSWHQSDRPRVIARQKWLEERAGS